jgi:hypothetical protein
MIPPLDKFCGENTADGDRQRFCDLMLGPSGDWRAAEKRWLELMRICLRDIDSESGDDRLREATRLTMEKVLKAAR